LHHPHDVVGTRQSDGGRRLFSHHVGVGVTPSRTLSSSSSSPARLLPRLPPGRRSVRAPRMRWTTTLHARFVHAVELLGGHESTSKLISPDQSIKSALKSISICKLLSTTCIDIWPIN
jgi:SHAQKYF class myb-like DNA-binding protein